MNENHDKTLYVRLPHTIKNMDEIRDLFVGDIEIKLPRQSSRHCHVIFSSVDEKIKNLKEVRKKMIDNKRIIAYPPKIKQKRQKHMDKKTVIHDPKPEKKITQILYVTNINPNTKTKDIKKALGECKSVTFLENYAGKSGTCVKQAIVRLTNPKLAAEYLKKERPWPVIDGNKLIIKSDTRKQKKKKPTIKIYDGDSEITNNVNFNTSTKKENENNEEKSSQSVKRLKTKKNKNNNEHSTSTTTTSDKEEEKE